MTNAFSKQAEMPVMPERPRTWSKPAMKTNYDVKGTYIDTACYWNALKNQKGVFSHLNLKRVFGSTAFNGWWEYGGAHYTLRDFKANPSDSHCWLEDAEGNVYDYCQPSWHYYAHKNGHPGKLPLGVEFRGVSKSALEALGLSYQPAPADAQAFLQRWVDDPRKAFMANIIEGWQPSPIREDLCGY